MQTDETRNAYGYARRIYWNMNRSKALRVVTSCDPAWLEVFRERFYVVAYRARKATGRHFKTKKVNSTTLHIWRLS